MKETFYKYEIERINDDEKILVKVYNTHAKKAWNSLVYYISFRTTERREEWITTFKQGVESREAYKAEKKAARINFKNPAKVGDILYSSWGYDQTNIDYYQVIAVKGKMVTLRKIRGRAIKGTEGFMCDHVKAAKDMFVENAEPFNKLVKPAGNGYAVTLTSYADAWLDDGKARYESWYA